MRISDWSSDVCSSDLVSVAKCSDRGEQPTTMTNRGDAESLQILSRQFRQDIGINVVGAEGLGVLRQIEALQPGRDVQLRLRPSRHCSDPKSTPNGSDQIGRASWRERVCQYV